MIVENAVKHGVTKRECGGRVVIATRKTDDGVQVIVTDDGVGFDAESSGRAASLSLEAGLGVGIPNARMRLAAQGGTLVIESEPGRGTRAVIGIPEEHLGGGAASLGSDSALHSRSHPPSGPTQAPHPPSDLTSDSAPYSSSQKEPSWTSS